MHSNKEILNFISRFKSFNEKELEEVFLYGNCYFFAIILKNRFPEMNIVYDAVDNHFMCLYDSKIYDIRGDITEITVINDLFSWDDYENIDSLEYKRIVRDCINLEEI